MSDPLTTAQARWVEQAAPRVPRLANAMTGMLGIDRDELAGIGNEALVLAATRYDPGLGVEFGRYAHYRIRGAMIDAARKVDRAGRQRRRAQHSLEASQALLSEAADGANERSTLAERIRHAKAIIDRTTASVLATRVAVDVDTRPGETGLDAETKLSVRNAVATLEDDDRELLRLLYDEGLVLREVAERSGKSVATISRRHTRALDRLAAAMREPRPP